MQKCRLKASRPRNQSINEVQFNIYSEFSEFSRKQLDRYTELFNTYDIDGTGKITVEGLKRMMEKLGLPQTHLRKYIHLFT
jgi:Ca2+-binding EF-hand superfamily protein